MQVSNQTEKEYRDKQTKFGHLSQGKELRSWLEETYYRDSIRERRYRGVANKFLSQKEGLKILEVAAGVGDFSVYCSRLFPKNTYFANELSQIQLERNIETVAKYFNVLKLPELSFGLAENLAYEGDYFDVVFIKAAVHHFENPNKEFEKIHKILKEGGVCVFFEDPICLDIPLYKTIQKRNFSLEERKLGINEHIYTVSEYFSFGKGFSKKQMYLDPVLVAEYDKHQKKRKGLKRIFGKLIRKSSVLFKNFIIWRFSPAVFVFTK